jgi:signal transduction histidine kinase/CheY-like chemotaxis protein
VTAPVPQALRAYTVTVAAVGAAAILIAALWPPLGAISPLLCAIVVLACWLVVVALLSASLHARSGDARRHAEELLKQEQAARADAETAGRAKDEFLATLSHELRTPLNALVGWLWWLRKGELDEARQARALETVERNTQALAQLIEDLLDVSRIITGKLRLKRRVVLPAPVAEAAVDAIRPAAVAKSIELTTTIDPDAGPVLADPERLQQVMWNLLSNAIKFTPEKGHVTVTLTRAATAVRLEVRDSGKGISPTLLPYIFDRFRQSETMLTTTPLGLGLGLSIVRHLVEVHGGRITATSPGEGRGATFTVTLPIYTEADAAPTTPAVDDAPRMEGLAILVVEDDPDARDWLVQTLAGWGARVATATSGREALDAVTRERLDVLVSDIRLPDTDGYELIRKIRDIEGALGRYTPAVALTAYPRVEDRARALQAGYQMHVPKPIAPSDLAAVIATLTNRHADT